MFNKSIKVNTSIDDKTIKLTIRGNVIPTPGKLRQKIGFLNSSKNKIDFGDIIFQQSSTQTIEVENTKQSEITMTVDNCPEYIKFELKPNILAPGEKGVIQVTFNSKFINTYGSSTENLKISMRVDKQVLNGSIKVIANIVEDFTKMSPQELADAPIIFFPKRSINIGEIKESQIKSIELEFENHGKSELIIRNVEVNNSAFIITEYNKAVKPGKKGKITLETNPEYISATLKTSINVIANDPKRSNTILLLYGTKKITKTALKNSKKLQKKYKNIKVQEANKLIEEYRKSEKLVILDVRTAKEYENGCIKGALNFDIQESNFKQTIQLLDRSRIYLVYCKSGIRSKEAITIMSKLGFENVFHMFEGIDSWEKNGLEVINPVK